MTDNDPGSGTITDIAKPSERGGFLGVFSLGPLVSSAITVHFVVLKVMTG